MVTVSLVWLYQKCCQQFQVGVATALKYVLLIKLVAYRTYGWNI